MIIDRFVLSRVESQIARAIDASHASELKKESRKLNDVGFE